MKPIDMVVQGKKVNASVIAAFAKRVGSIDEVISVWANAGALQLAQHGNLNWLAKLFEMPLLTLKSGDLNKLGAEVMRYISAHYPAVKWDKENHKVARAKVTAANIQYTHFVDLTATAADVVEGGKIVKQGEKFYRPHGDFSLTFAQWREAQAAAEGGEDDPLPTVTAKAFAKQLEKALAAVEAKRFVGAEDELSAALGKAIAMVERLTALTAKAQDETPKVDVGAALQVLETGRKGKSARAGGKVDKADDKAVA